MGDVEEGFVLSRHHGRNEKSAIRKRTPADTVRDD